MAPMLLVGSLTRSLSEKGADVVGFIDDVDIGLVKSSFPVLAPVNRLHAVVHEFDIDVVAVSEEVKGEKLKTVMQECQNAKVKLKRYSYEYSEKSWNLSEFSLHELLGREKVVVSLDELNEDLHAKTVLVTGAGGSIGSEVCRQVANYNIESDHLSMNRTNGLASMMKQIQMYAIAFNSLKEKGIMSC